MNLGEQIKEQIDEMKKEAMDKFKEEFDEMKKIRGGKLKEIKDQIDIIDKRWPIIVDLFSRFLDHNIKLKEELSYQMGSITKGLVSVINIYHRPAHSAAPDHRRCLWDTKYSEWYSELSKQYPSILEIFKK